MDIYERRRRRLQEILTERFPGRGGRSTLASRLERQPGYVSRCLNGGKRIGEAFARHVEERLQLPAFWLDGPLNTGADLSGQQIALLHGFAELTAEQQSELLASLDDTIRRNRAIYIHLARRDHAVVDDAG